MTSVPGRALTNLNRNTVDYHAAGTNERTASPCTIVAGRHCKLYSTRMEATQKDDATGHGASPTLAISSAVETVEGLAATSQTRARGRIAGFMLAYETAAAGISTEAFDREEDALLRAAQLEEPCWVLFARSQSELSLEEISRHGAAAAALSQRVGAKCGTQQESSHAQDGSLLAESSSAANRDCHSSRNQSANTPSRPRHSELRQALLSEALPAFNTSSAPPLLMSQGEQKCEQTVASDTIGSSHRLHCLGNVTSRCMDCNASSDPETDVDHGAHRLTCDEELGRSALTTESDVVLLGREGAMRAPRLLQAHGNGETSFGALPTWETWRFRRTLAYWVATMFLEGSILFTIGGSFQFFAVYASNTQMSTKLSDSVVLTPYLVGSINFTVGAWAGIEELLRLPRSRDGMRLGRPRLFCFAKLRHWAAIRQVTSWEPIVAYPLYFIGALLFNINCFVGFLTPNKIQLELLVWMPGCIGSLCFVVGGLCECSRNWDRIFSIDMLSAPAVQSTLDLLGGVLFLLAASSGAVLLDGNEQLRHWFVDFAYLAGSLSFAAASVAGVWMWKGEQYGLALVPEINLATDMAASSEYTIHQAQLAQYGCGRSSGYQIPWLILYLVNASASVIAVALALNCSGSVHEVAESLLNFALSHGIVALGSVVHHVPTAAPHSWLIWYMRLLLMLYTLNSWAKIGRQVAGTYNNSNCA